ncbi:MAG: carboxypeptidase regulatory-like domain-containing protein [Bryobacteraceae bacterium]|nr:carboxypeptidase regulatory-like domain-containing protein [Bryobacteraceae bacterium]
MKRTFALFLSIAALITLPLSAQSVYSEILGTVTDASGAAVSSAKVSVRSLDTGALLETTTGDGGAFRFRQLQPGNFEVTIEKSGFAKYVQGPIVLRLNQNADLQVKLSVSGVSEVVTVSADATQINTSNAEVSTAFEAKRVSELPLAPNRNILNLALSIPGVNQLSSGQSAFANGGVNFAVNGMRTRSNNFMIDGQDSNDPSVTGNQQSINNPDIVAEVRIITSQFLPEYGRAGGSVVSIVTKQGTNDFHGSAFWFYNGNRLNTLSNLEANARVTKVPFRVEHQFGGTVGGPIVKNKTFFFASLQRWTDRQLGFGTTLNGAPTEAGRQIISRFTAGRPQLQALLDYLPAAQQATGVTVPLTSGGQTFAVPVGSITGSGNILQNNWQGTGRFDHRFNDKHLITGRYMILDDFSSGAGSQVTPAGYLTVNPLRTHSATMSWNWTPGAAVYNEFRTSYQRYESASTAENPASENIPSIEVRDLGLLGFNAAASRTAIGLAVNLPQFRRNNTYQIQNTTGVVIGKHSMKFGFDFRRVDIVSFFGPTSRGRIEYPTLQAMHDDIGTVATINATLPGGGVIWPFKGYDYYGFWQDEWRMTRRFTLTYGVRYESPAPPLDQLLPINDRIIAAAGGNQAYRLSAIPKRDQNNFAPRVGFNYRLTDSTVLRGGYARSYDSQFFNLTLNVASAFPFLNSVNFVSGGSAANAYQRVQQARTSGVPADPRTANRTIIGEDQYAPVAEQFSFQVQRELASDWVLTTGWVGTKGSGLFQTIDENPIVPGSSPARRVNTELGVIRNRCNCSSSIYHSWQTTIEKRLSRNFAMGAHYTWSSFIDNASEVFNSSVGEVAVAQDSFNRNGDRGRSSFDRPHRFTANGVWELPFMRDQKGFAGRLLGGWQLSPFITLQSGAAFTVLNGSDPGGRLAGISGLVGVAIRPNITPEGAGLDLSNLTVERLYRLTRELGGATRLFQGVTAAQGVGNAGRNILRAKGITNVDLGIIKNTRFNERINTQFRADFFNASATRNFGVPDATFTSTNFLNQWATDAGRRRVQLSLRLTF